MTKPCPFCHQPMRLTQQTYTPRFVCSVCGLDVQKVVVAAEAEAPGHWEVLSVLTEVGGLSAKELADKIARIIDREIIAANEGEILIQIFVWKNGFIEVVPPHLLDIGEK